MHDLPIISFRLINVSKVVWGMFNRKMLEKQDRASSSLGLSSVLSIAFNQ